MNKSSPGAVRVKVWTRVGPTEDDARVRQAVGTFFPEMKFERVGEKWEGQGEGREVLSEFRNAVWAKKILDTVRGRFIHRIEGNRTEILIHKQAAFVKKLGLVDSDRESSLGAIHVVIESEELEKLVDWLAPKTKEGKPVRKNL
ncbi:MAG TPA: hypothetical protein ENN60_04210 [archaeon]|nr:hypothetical protein [archaeon]